MPSLDLNRLSLHEGASRYQSLPSGGRIPVQPGQADDDGLASSLSVVATPERSPVSSPSGSAFAAKSSTITSIDNSEPSPPRQRREQRTGSVGGPSRTPSHHNASTSFGKLPPELIFHILSFVDPLGEESFDRLHLTRVCKAWTRPAMIMLHKDMYLTTTKSISMLRSSLDTAGREYLIDGCRSFAFMCQEPDFMDKVDLEDAVWLCRRLVRCEDVRWQAEPTEEESGLWAELTLNFTSLTSLDISGTCEGGLYTRHIISAFQCDNLERLRLGYLTTAAEELDCMLEQRDIEPPSTLKEITLFKPNMDETALQYLLEITAASVRKLSLEMGDAEDDMGWLSEADAERALFTAGSSLKELSIMWPRATRPWLNDAVRGLRNVEHIAAAGIVCDTGMDRNCPPSLKHMDIYVQVGFSGYAFQKLWKPGFRVSNVTRYHIITRTQEPEDKITDRWTEETIESWRVCVANLERVGVTMTGDFF